MTEILSTRTVYQGRVFAVHVERVVLQNGVARDLDIVRHPPSVVLVVMPDADSVLLVRQHRHPVAQSLWELPAGTLEPNEEPEPAARRECEEETGYAPSRLERLGAFFPVPGYCDEEMIFYKASGLTRPDTPANPDDDEFLEPRVFSLAEAREMVRRGEIKDLKSAFGLSLV